MKFRVTVQETLGYAASEVYGLNLPLGHPLVEFFLYIGHDVPGATVQATEPGRIRTYEVIE